MTSADDDAMTTWELGLDPELLASLRVLRARPPFAETDYVATRAATRAEALARVAEPHVLRVYDDIVPGREGRPAVPARVYVPTRAARDVVVHLHGGGYVFGDLDSTDGYARTLARETGRIVVSVDYRLAPEHPYPAAIDDADLVFDWLLAGGVPGAGTDRITLHGASAGSGLAAGLCLRRRDRGQVLPHALVLVVPCIDPARDTPSYQEFEHTTVLSRDNLGWMWAQYLGAPPVVDDYSAPAGAGDLSGLPPTFVATAEYDPLRDEGATFARRLAAAGVRTRTVCYPDTTHGFLVFPRLAQARTLMHDTTAFLAEVESPG